MTAVLRSAESAEMELTNEELVAECKARANVYRLLAGVFLEEPTAAYLNALRSDEGMAMLQEMGAAFGEDFTAMPLPQLQDALAIEYAALFVVSGGCPAIESVRLHGRLQQQPYFEVREIYQKAGFKVVGARFAIYDDQLGAQLSFVAELLERAAAALGSGDRVGYERLTKEIKRFWALHPGKWVRGYATLLERAAEHSFFREMAKLLGGFAQWELDLLGVRVEDLDGGKLKVPKSEIEYEYDPAEPVCNACDKGRESGNKADEEFSNIDISRIQDRLAGQQTERKG
ncbi:MAG: molecular chaperone TorD family protein [Gammaproteobacteria bacterium]|nr:molecular chaperone TorD family protein [Gammaproteobacteria bacterium]MBU1777776.1 molecular chaperone TorD family protein [Gammaproteobacteria bacterium]MBU1969982.1 molecular chaperone TorD family protein [Gammaproteobacteria bacterium]